MSETNIIYGQLLQVRIPEKYKYIAIDGKKHQYIVYAFTHEPYWDNNTKVWAAGARPFLREKENTEAESFYCLGPYYDAFETTSTKPPVKPSKSLRKI